jgi:hypothetical protein
VKQAAVTALLVEPVPRTFVRLARTSETEPHVTCRQVAIVLSDDEWTAPFFCFAPNALLAREDL